MPAIVDRLRRALDAEEAWQRSELEAHRSRTWAEQVALGVAWPEVRVDEVRPGRRGRWIWTVRSKVVLHDGITSGERVSLGAAGATEPRWRGVVQALDTRVAEIAVETDDDAPDGLRVARRFDPTSFARQRDALQAVSRSESPLAQLLLEQASWRVADPHRVPTDGLDASQRQALGRALSAEALAVIYGPPGTGKTRTLVALLRALVEEGDRPWALADSNAATDHLAVEAAAAGLLVVRVGPIARISARAAPLALDARIAQHPVRPAIARIDKELIRLRSDPNAWRERKALSADRDRLEALARREILTSAQVIATTLGSLPRFAPEVPRARTAVIDEATQATEPATWVAAAWVDRLVLAGDPHQLGPVVFQPGNPLSESLLQRLLVRAPAEVAAGMLEVQRRMHGQIQALVQPVYGERYRADPGVVAWTLPEVAPVLFIDTAGSGLDESRDPITGSWFNEGEVRVIALVVQGWREAGVRDIGVITPYSAQVARLAQALPGIEVATVNGFQGREKDAIAISMVRSNLIGETGFALDRRRLTVALTRARKALVLVADSATLARTATGSALLAALEPDQTETVWAEPWSAALDGG